MKLKLILLSVFIFGAVISEKDLQAADKKTGF